MKADPVRPPAPRDGIPASRLRAKPGDPPTVLALLQARLPHIGDWAERLRDADVLNADGQPVAAADPCPPGRLLWYWRRTAPEPRVPFELGLLHRCERLVVVDKPPFLAVTPGGRHVQETVLLRLQRQLGLPSLSPLHRLDRDTQGVLAFAVRPADRDRYQALWRERAVTKVYEAIAPWSDALDRPLRALHRLVEPDDERFMQMQVVAGDPNAETWVERLHEVDPAHTPGATPGQRLALYRLTPLTGRKHQLRAQMAALGLPLVGDRIYPRLEPWAPDDFSRPLMLLARSLAFVDPVDGQARRFESRLRLDGARD